MISEFTRDNKFYLLFTLDKGKEKEYPVQYLYLSNFKGTIASLIFGKDIQSEVTKLSQQKESCIECSLGVNIVGGVSKDSGQVVEHGMLKEDANEILKELRNNTEFRIFAF